MITITQEEYNTVVRGLRMQLDLFHRNEKSFLDSLNSKEERLATSHKLLRESTEKVIALTAEIDAMKSTKGKSK